MISKLDQKKFFRRNQSFEIGEDQRLYVSVSGPFKQEKWSIPLQSLNLNPARIQHLDLRPLILIIPFSLLALPFLIAACVAFYQGKFGWGPLFLGGALGILAGIFSLRMYLTSINALIFTGTTGARLPLWFNNPTQEGFQSFVDALKKSIEAAQITQPQNTSLTAEIQKLKELFDRGLLDKDQFESAKNKLTGNERNRKVGF